MEVAVRGAAYPGHLCAALKSLSPSLPPLRCDRRSEGGRDGGKEGGEGVEDVGLTLGGAAYPGHFVPR